ncbi:MAG TPA: permease prefix domain 1-containing protein [Gemmatimonadales bacterium]
MASFRALRRGLVALFRPRQADADVADEVAHYREAAEAEHRARGLDPEAARRAAQMELGGDLAVREQVRTSGWEHVLETTLLDVRHALRGLRASPVFTVAAVATFAVGIGASTAVFSAVRPILLEPLPFPAADRLVTLDDRNAEGFPMPATLGTYDEVRVRARAFEALAAADVWRPSLTGSGTPERLRSRSGLPSASDPPAIWPAANGVIITNSLGGWRRHRALRRHPASCSPSAARRGPTSRGRPGPISRRACWCAPSRRPSPGAPGLRSWPSWRPSLCCSRSRR